jgi:hypothetical protein
MDEKTFYKKVFNNICLVVYTLNSNAEIKEIANYSEVMLDYILVEIDLWRWYLDNKDNISNVDAIGFNIAIMLEIKEVWHLPYWIRFNVDDTPFIDRWKWIYQKNRNKL